jgi:hypothetical protein
MSMKLDVDTVKAGTITFVVTNDAKRTPHEMILVKLKAKGEQLPLDGAKQRINEKQINSLGDFQPETRRQRTPQGKCRRRRLHTDLQHQGPL